MGSADYGMDLLDPRYLLSTTDRFDHAAVAAGRDYVQPKSVHRITGGKLGLTFIGQLGGGSLGRGEQVTLAPNAWSHLRWHGSALEAVERNGSCGKRAIGNYRWRLANTNDGPRVLF